MLPLPPELSATSPAASWRQARIWLWATILMSSREFKKLKCHGFYELGNFIFDQWRTENKQGVTFLVRVDGTRFQGYELIPAHVDRDGRVHLAESEESVEILERIQAASAELR